MKFDSWLWPFPIPTGLDNIVFINLADALDTLDQLENLHTSLYQEWSVGQDTPQAFNRTWSC